MAWLVTLLSTLRRTLRSRASLQVENLALRHQLGIYRRNCRRPRIRAGDRIFWSWLSRVWTDWRDALVVVQPETVNAWRHRMAQTEVPGVLAETVPLGQAGQTGGPS